MYDSDEFYNSTRSLFSSRNIFTLRHYSTRIAILLIGCIESSVGKKIQKPINKTRCNDIVFIWLNLEFIVENHIHLNWSNCNAHTNRLERERERGGRGMKRKREMKL